MARKVNIFKFNRPINLYCFTDVHLGAKEHDAKAFKFAVEKCKKDPSGYCFFNGDNMEIIPPNYGIPENGQDLTNGEQTKEFVSILKYLGKKVLFLRNGNHDQRVFRLSSVDIIEHINRETKVPMLHLGMEEVHIYVKKRKFRMVTTHGSGGTSKTILNNLKLAFPGADVYFSGDTHELYCNPGNLTVDTSNGIEEFKPQLEMVGGSFMGWADYAREVNRIPRKVGYYILHFKNDGVSAHEG